MAEDRRRRGDDTAMETFKEKMNWTAGSYLYASPSRRPKLLEQLESYLERELQTIDHNVPNHQALKLQVYRNVFDCFIKEFKTYQPLLSAIKKEYDNALLYQQNRIHELEPMQAHVRLVTEDCERKIQAHLAEEQKEIQELKREKRQLQRDIEAMREGEKAMQTMVDRLQSELSSQYLQFREERDARVLLICQLNDLRSCYEKEQHPTQSQQTNKQTELQFALKVCQEDLQRAQEELKSIKSKRCDVMPQDGRDSSELKSKETLQQLKKLQAEFDQLKKEHDSLQEFHRGQSSQTKTAAQQGENSTTGELSCLLETQGEKKH